MIDAVENNNLKELKRLFICSDDKSILYWHIVKCFKLAYRERKIEMLQFMIDDLDMPLKHEAFDGFLFIFIYICQGAEEDKDEV